VRPRRDSAGYQSSDAVVKMRRLRGNFSPVALDHTTERRGGSSASPLPATHGRPGPAGCPRVHGHPSRWVDSREGKWTYGGAVVRPRSPGSMPPIPSDRKHPSLTGRPESVFAVKKGTTQSDAGLHSLTVGR